MIDAYNGALTSEIQRLGRLFASRYPLKFSTDANGTLQHGTTPITYQETTQPDRYTATAGVAATVLTRKGADFERTSTSITDASGKRASACRWAPTIRRLRTCSKASPTRARPECSDATSHPPPPIKDDAGQVIGAFFVGLDFTDGLAALKKKVLAVKIGDTGYPMRWTSGATRAS